MSYIDQPIQIWGQENTFLGCKRMSTRSLFLMPVSSLLVPHKHVASCKSQCGLRKSEQSRASRHWQGNACPPGAEPSRRSVTSGVSSTKLQPHIFTLLFYSAFPLPMQEPICHRCQGRVHELLSWQTKGVGSRVSGPPQEVAVPPCTYSSEEELAHSRSVEA